MAEKIKLWFELYCPQEGYVNALDNRFGRLPEFFADKRIYETVRNKNADDVLPVGMIYSGGQITSRWSIPRHPSWCGSVQHTIYRSRSSQEVI